jgi:hypothetical protein
MSVLPSHYTVFVDVIVFFYHFILVSALPWPCDFVRKMYSIFWKSYPAPEFPATGDFEIISQITKIRSSLAIMDWNDWFHCYIGHDIFDHATLLAISKLLASRLCTALENWNYAFRTTLGSKDTGEEEKLQKQYHDSPVSFLPISIDILLRNQENSYVPSVPTARSLFRPLS